VGPDAGSVVRRLFSIHWAMFRNAFMLIRRATSELAYENSRDVRRTYASHPTAATMMSQANRFCARDHRRGLSSPLLSIGTSQRPFRQLCLTSVTERSGL
jgi:hypothetical protein